MDNKFTKVPDINWPEHIDLSSFTPSEIRQIREHNFMMLHDGIASPLRYSIQLDYDGHIIEELLINGEWFKHEGVPDKYALGRVIGNSGYGIEVIYRVEDLSGVMFKYLDLLKAVILISHFSQSLL